MWADGRNVADQPDFILTGAKLKGAWPPMRMCEPMDVRHTIIWKYIQTNGGN